jgi:hypothetical protein
MREVAFDGIRIPALIVEQGRCSGPKAVNGERALLKAHPPERREHAVVGQRPLGGSGAREYEAAVERPRGAHANDTQRLAECYWAVMPPQQ